MKLINIHRQETTWCIFFNTGKTGSCNCCQGLRCKLKVRSASNNLRMNGPLAFPKNLSAGRVCVSAELSPFGCILIQLHKGLQQQSTVMSPRTGEPPDGTRHLQSVLHDLGHNGSVLLDQISDWICGSAGFALGLSVFFSVAA